MQFKYTLFVRVSDGGTPELSNADWPFNNIRYTIDGGNLGTTSKFYIEPNTGIIKLLDSLDREIQAQYKLVVRATDTDNDIEPDPLRQRSSSVVVTINIW
uniref:Protocadherin-like protein n=1 Tax=Phascolarctos cinereus TaxID=38626 RepID=A0A6P5K525_PHACI|nr:protocadherin-like protein [Phascolarctos cinereus]